MFSVTGLALVLALSGVIDPPEKPRLQDPDDVLSGATKVLFWDSLRLWQEAGFDVYVDIRKSLDEPPTEVSARRIKTWVGEKRVGAVYVCDVEKRQYALTLSTDAKALVPETELVRIFNDAMRMPYVNGSI